MAAASSLFYSSNDPDKQTLTRRITPTQEQFEDQQERWNLLADHLLADLNDRSGYSIQSWLQGSYKFGTQIRPTRIGQEFDIDLGVYYCWEGSDDGGDHRPKELKSMVQESLQTFADDNQDIVREVTWPKKRCCRIRFDKDFHIDVPAYHLDPDEDARSLATEDDEWEDSDPKAIYAWFKGTSEDQARAKVRRVVKYLKAWASLKFAKIADRPSSILLTVLVADAAVEIGVDELGPDDEALQAILDKIVKRLDEDTDVLNPANKQENLSGRLSFEQIQQIIQKLRTFLDVADRAVEQDEEIAAADIWQEAFEHMFPMPDLTEELTKSINTLPARVVFPEVDVAARTKTNPPRTFHGSNAIGPIPKDCDITFTVTNPLSLPSGAEINWMVRNEGNEAENTNDLGHKAGEGLVAFERSAYRGRHYMDCVVKLAGRTVAMRRIPVDISGLTMPARNPPRPSYVRLRGRRT